MNSRKKIGIVPIEMLSYKDTNMKDLIRRSIIIGAVIGMVLIFHETIPRPYVYFADFIGGMVLGLYWGKR